MSRVYLWKSKEPFPSVSFPLFDKHHDCKSNCLLEAYYNCYFAHLACKGAIVDSDVDRGTKDTSPFCHRRLIIRVLCPFVRDREISFAKQCRCCEPGWKNARFRLSEEWETRKKKEITTTRQIETRVKRQVVLEDGEVVVDTGPFVTTNTTEDVEQQEHTTQEVRTFVQ